MTIGAIQSGANAPTGNPRTTMDTYQFLRLLIVELTSQNPMDPVKDRDFLAQMAQLNTAQQMERIGNMFTTFQTAGLIGREVDAALPTLLALNPDVLIVTGDHSTPAKLKSHSWHPVPTLLHAPATAMPDRGQAFGERECLCGALGQFPSTDLMMLALAHARRFTKYGA